MLCKEWLYIWIENCVQPSVKQRTYSRYNEIIDKHIIPKLGNKELNEITPQVLQYYIKELLEKGNLKTGKGLSSNSVNSIITVLQGALKAACSFGIVCDYIGDKIIRPKFQEKVIECFSLCEQKKIERYILSKEPKKYLGILDVPVGVFTMSHTKLGLSFVRRSSVGVIVILHKSYPLKVQSKFTTFSGRTTSPIV